jgi:hypothetical protein
MRSVERVEYGELHTAFPDVRAAQVTDLAPPPEAISDQGGQPPRRGELQHLDRMGGELDVHGGQPNRSPYLDQRLGLVAAQVPKPPIVKPVGKPEDGRDVRQGVRHRHPEIPSRPKHARCFPHGGQVVGDVLDHGDREDRGERSGYER